MKYEWRLKLKKIIEDRYIQEQKEWYNLIFSTNGLVNVTVVSERFTNIPYPQRREQIAEILRESDAPVRGVGLHSLHTLSEADSIRLSKWTTRPTSRADNWLDLTDQAINITEYPKVQRREPRIPHTVTFYSFKGGVGRTTALIHVAWLLALRGRKVVAVDLDANAAGLGALLHLTPMPEGDILDYFCERSDLPEDIEPTFPITKIFGEVRVPNTSGRLFVVPVSPVNLDYITKVEDLRTAAIPTQHGKKLWSLFFQEITELLQPDIILIDSSAGFDEWAAFSLLRAADQAIVFLYPDEQNKRGIELLLEALGGTLPLQLVFSPVPFGDAGRERVREYWQALQDGLDRATDQANVGGDEESQEVEAPLCLGEPITLYYFPELALAPNYPVLPLLSNYVDIANVIDEGVTAVGLKKPQTLN
jgi:cellulose biosynthesis protein BcsQ